jgi:NAD(P)-dependent dehydrogenase (short-subunit alcohol dehydrogenase family)
VVLVAGATRGVGRGIALAFGEAGATVYCTGRSSRAALASGTKPLSSQQRKKALPAAYYTGRPETIEETAELVTARGGKGIAVVVDHLDVSQVEKLVAEIRAEQGKLHVLVNDISESAEHTSILLGG